MGGWVGGRRRDKGWGQSPGDRQPLDVAVSSFTVKVWWKSNVVWCVERLVATRSGAAITWKGKPRMGFIT